MKDRIEMVTETKRRRWSCDDTKMVVEVRCCDHWLSCPHFTNTCENCESDYNFSGQRLAPRSQWGEETGESWQDCY